MSAPRSEIDVLVVDDDHDIRDAVAELLRDERYVVSTASNGAEALAVLRAVRPRLILLDLNMPTMNGAQFRAAQQNDPTIAAIPTVILTAIDRIDETTAELAAADAIAKPIKLPHLLAVVERHVRGG